jgi:hypothetical protein
LATEHWSLLATRNVLASTAMFITVVNAIVAGALASLIALAADAPGLADRRDRRRDRLGIREHRHRHGQTELQSRQALQPIAVYAECP